MTHVDEQGIVWVIEEPPGRCELCGAVAETRPYGREGEQVCFACGMQDEVAARARFARRLEGGGS